MEIEHECRISLLHALVNQSDSLTLDGSLHVLLFTLWNNLSLSNRHFIRGAIQLEKGNTMSWGPSLNLQSAIGDTLSIVEMIVEADLFSHRWHKTLVR